MPIVDGIRKATGVITIAVPNVAQQIWLPSQGRSIIIKKIWCFGALANAVVDIGTGIAGFAAIFPSLNVLAGLAVTYTEDEIPASESNTAITVRSTVINVLVQLEVEERGA